MSMAFSTILHTCVSLAYTYVLFSLVEYGVHRWLMHRMRFAKLLKSKWLRKLCYDHMAKHHKRAYRHTDRSKDDSLLLISIAGLLPGLVVSTFVYFFVDQFTFYVSFWSSLIYMITWWIVHLEMHRDAGYFYSKNRVFQYLERRHVLHHAFPNTNFNVLLPLFDWVFRTRPTPEQINIGRHLSHQDVDRLAASA